MNSGHISFVPIATLMFLTGIGIPVLATFNAQLGQQLASPWTATFVLFTVGFVLSGLAMLAIGGLPDISRFTMERPYIYLAAIFMVAYLVSMTWAAPHIGIANAVFFVLLGQLIAAAVIDHFGLWGALTTPLTLRRVAGIAVMTLGIYLARKPV